MYEESFVKISKDCACLTAAGRIICVVLNSFGLFSVYFALCTFEGCAVFAQDIALIFFLARAIFRFATLL